MIKLTFFLRGLYNPVEFVTENDGHTIKELETQVISVLKSMHISNFTSTDEKKTLLLKNDDIVGILIDIDSQPSSNKTKDKNKELKVNKVKNVEENKQITKKEKEKEIINKENTEEGERVEKSIQKDEVPEIYLDLPEVDNLEEDGEENIPKEIIILEEESDEDNTDGSSINIVNNPNSNS